MKLTKCLLLLVALGVPFAAGADDDWFRGRLFPPEIVLRNATALKLTDAQRKTIRTEIVKVQTAVAGVDVELMEEGLAMQEAIDKSPIDRNTVLTHAENVFAAESRKKRAWIEMLINIKNALTPAQIDSLRSITGTETKP